MKLSCPPLHWHAKFFMNATRWLFYFWPLAGIGFAAFIGRQFHFHSRNDERFAQLFTAWWKAQVLLWLNRGINCFIVMFLLASPLTLARSSLSGRCRWRFVFN